MHPVARADVRHPEQPAISCNLRPTCAIVAGRKPALPRRGAEGVGKSKWPRIDTSWVWLSVALLAIGAATYVTTVFSSNHLVSLATRAT
jgi:hypothetical protein